MKKKEVLTFGCFIKKIWWVLIILIMIPLVAIGIFSYLMINEIRNVSDLGSMLGGSLAYIGTVILGIVSVWQVERQRQDTLEAILQQNFEQNKGCLQIYAETVFNEVALVVKNTGKSEICNGSITFDKTWLEQLDAFGDITKDLKYCLEKSLSNNIYLASNQEIRFALHFLGKNNNYFSFLIENDCPVVACYDTLGKTVEQELNLNFHSVLSCYHESRLENKWLNYIENKSEKFLKEIEKVGNRTQTLNDNTIKLYERLSENKKKSDK